MTSQTYISAMRILFGLLLIISTLAVKAQDGWQVIKTEDGKATVMMPDTPKFTTKERAVTGGVIVNKQHLLDLASLGDGNLVIALAQAEYPVIFKSMVGTPEGLKRFYDSGILSAAGEDKNGILSDIELEVAGHKGRRFTVILPDGKSVMTMIQFQIGNTGYFARVISKKGEQDNEEAKKFLDSFQLDLN